MQSLRSRKSLLLNKPLVKVVASGKSNIGVSFLKKIDHLLEISLHGVPEIVANNFVQSMQSSHFNLSAAFSHLSDNQQ